MENECEIESPGTVAKRGTTGRPRCSEIERIAREYADQGYEVIVEPSAADLPDFVREYQLDLIAKSSEVSIRNGS